MNSNRYYNECHEDYRRIWRLDKSLGLHYGYHPKGKTLRHDEAITMMNQVLAEKAGITSADHVLDAGCGIGGSCIWLARNTGCQVTGISINSKQLEIACGLAFAYGLLWNKVVFLNMDYSKTNFPNGDFNVVWLLESSCHAEDKRVLAREVRRIMAPGGRLVVADGFLTRGYTPMVRQWCRGWAVPNLATIGEFRNCLEDAGFTSIEYENITANVMPSSVRLWRYAFWLYPLALLMELVGLRTSAQTANVRSAVLQRQIFTQGIAQYGVFTARKE
jgi:tocopherol O-methyltransferase